MEAKSSFVIGKLRIFANCLVICRLFDGQCGEILFHECTDILSHGRCSRVIFLSKALPELLPRTTKLRLTLLPLFTLLSNAPRSPFDLNRSYSWPLGAHQKA